MFGTGLNLNMISPKALGYNLSFLLRKLTVECVRHGYRNSCPITMYMHTICVLILPCQNILFGHPILRGIKHGWPNTAKVSKYKVNAFSCNLYTVIILFDVSN